MNSETARLQMVNQQIRTWDVFAPDVLQAFSAIEKERFVPEGCTDVAYADTEIPLPHGQCMLRASIVGRMVQALAIEPGDRVLEVGTGTGYLTACLASIARHVTSIDIFPDFTAAAAPRLAELDIDNVKLETLDATLALPEGEFDAIAVTASMPVLDERLANALSPGGRLFAFVGNAPVMQALLVTRNADGTTIVEPRFETNVPPLVATPRRAAFTF